MIDLVWIARTLLLVSLVSVAGFVFGLRSMVAACAIPVVCYVPPARTVLTIGVSHSEQYVHVGLAAMVIVLSTTSVFMLAGGILLLWCNPQRFPWAFAPFVVYLLAGMCFLWPSGVMYWSGVVAWFVGLGGFCVGVYVALLCENQRLETIFLRSLIFVSAVQVFIGAFQISGVSILLQANKLDDSLVGRASGTFGHPNNLGPAMLCVLAVSLTYLFCDGPRTRTRAGVASGLAFCSIVMSGGRASLVGGLILVVGTVVLAVLSGRVRIRLTIRTWGLLLISIVLASIGMYVILRRDRMDPVGGYRDHFLEVWRDHVLPVLSFGVGPNGYIEYFGRFDDITRKGWPVHNSIFFAIAEIGLIGVLLLLLPLLMRWLQLVSRKIFKRSFLGDRARILFLLPIALYPSMSTGWALVSLALFPIVFFTFGFLLSNTDRNRRCTADIVSSRYVLVSKLSDRSPPVRSRGVGALYESAVSGDGDG